jgi:hypothetical protein
VQLRHWAPGKAVETWTSPNWRDVQALADPSDTGVRVLARRPDQILVSLFTQTLLPGGVIEEMARVATFNGKTWTITHGYIHNPALMDGGDEGAIMLRYLPSSYALIAEGGALRDLPMAPLSTEEQKHLEIVAATDHSGVVWASSREHLYRRQKGRWEDVPIPKMEGHVLEGIQIGPVSQAETWVTVSYVRDEDTPNADSVPNYSTLSKRVNALAAHAPLFTVVYRTRRPSETLHCVVGDDEVLEPVTPAPDASCAHRALLVNDATDDEGGRRLGALFAAAPAPAPEGQVVWVHNLGRTRLAIRPSDRDQDKKWQARAHDLSHWLEPACIDDKADVPLRESLEESK